jgi:hypothetical protein
MILGAQNPIENAPGHDGMANTKIGSKFNKQVQCKAVLYAMLFWFSDRAMGGVWREVSAMYWKHKGKNVLANLRQCAKRNEYLRAYDKDGPDIFIRKNIFGAQGRTGRVMDLVAMLEKHLGSEGSKSSREQGPSRFRY